MKKCKKCNKEFEPSKGLLNFCSLTCRNTKVHTEETKKNISKGLANSKFNKERTEARKAIYWDKNYSVCVICNKRLPRRGKTCSQQCLSRLRSQIRINYILEKGIDCFSTKRELYEYKNISILCDSKLEQAAIRYLVDEKQASDIKRFDKAVEFVYNDCIKLFNPDFIVKIKQTTYIVEVKLLWTTNFNHPYNVTIPAKKIALEKYCKRKGYKMIWLDFDYDIKFKEIYMNRDNKPS